MTRSPNADAIGSDDAIQKKNPAQFWGRVFCCLVREIAAAEVVIQPLELRLAAQLTASVTATGAGTVVRLRDFAIVLGHVMSSIRIRGCWRGAAI